MHSSAETEVDAHHHKRKTRKVRDSKGRSTIPDVETHYERSNRIFCGICRRGGEANMSMEGRLTLCNLSIEMGARGGFIAPDETTFEYIKGKEYAPKGEEWDKAVAYWKTLKSGDDAVFDKELTFDAADIEPRVTYGTNPGMGIGITRQFLMPPRLVMQALRKP